MNSNLLVQKKRNNEGRKFCVWEGSIQTKGVFMEQGQKNHNVLASAECVKDVYVALVDNCCWYVVLVLCVPM